MMGREKLNQQLSQGRARPRHLWRWAIGAFFLISGLVACGGGGSASSSAGIGAPNSPITPSPDVGRLELMLGGVGGYGNVDGVGEEARFSSPTGVVVDEAGNVYVGDTGNAAIRKITPAGVVTTFAGKAGEKGQSDGNAQAARFLSPGAIARDKEGNLFVVDSDLIRKITPAGAVTTFAKNPLFERWDSLAVDRLGRVYGTVRTLSGCFSGRPCTASSTDLQTITVADPKAAVVESVGESGIGRQLMNLATDADGNVVLLRLREKQDTFEFFQLSAQGVFEDLKMPESARTLIGYCSPCDFNADWHARLAVDSTGTFHVALRASGGVRAAVRSVWAKFFRNGAPPTFQSALEGGATDGSFSDAAFRNETAGGLTGGIAVGTQQQLYWVDTGNHTLRVVTPSAKVSTLAGKAPSTEYQEGVQAVLPLHTDLEVLQFLEVAVSPNGNHLYAQMSGPRQTTSTVAMIHRIDRTGVGLPVTLLGASQAARFSVDDVGDIYYNGLQYGSNGVLKSSWDKATWDDFDGNRFYSSQEFTVLDRLGSLYLANSEEIRVFDRGLNRLKPLAGRSTNSIAYFPTQDGIGSAARFLYINGLAVDLLGNAYVAENAYVETSSSVESHSKIRKVSPTGSVTTLAGRDGVWGADDGPGTVATFRNAQALTVDRKGNVYVADTGNHTIREITPEGVVSTVVGQTGKAGVSLGALPGRLTSPTGVAIDDNNLLYIATPGAVLRVRMPQ
jgi:sugar lactone lactonase YvrE